MIDRKKYPVIRVWPEWYSSGIWAPPFPASQTVGPMLDYDQLDLPPELVTRFEDWQGRFDDMRPEDSNSSPQPSWEAFQAEKRELAHALHALIGGCVQWEEDGLIRTVGEDGPGLIPVPRE